jgi:hypothetical protein
MVKVGVLRSGNIYTQTKAATLLIRHLKLLRTGTRCKAIRFEKLPPHCAESEA